MQAVSSADWVTTEYNNQSAPSTFYAYGAIGVQTRAAGTAGVAVVNRGAGISWYSSSWLYRKPITIDHSKVSGTASSTLNSFPVLVSVIDPQLKYTGYGGLVASSTGADILFTKADGTTLLNYEIESYASTTGQLIAWVNIPILSALTDTAIYEYFGNASASTETSGNKTGTWNSNFTSVYHLNNDPAGSAPQMKDSTSNGVGLTEGSGGTYTTITGQTGNGLYLNEPNQYGGAYLNSSSSSGTGTGAFTMSTWLYFPSSFFTTDSGYSWVLGVGADYTGANTSPFGFFIKDDGTFYGAVQDSGGSNNTILTGPKLSTATWYHCVLTWDGSSSFVMYVNGTAYSGTYTHTRTDQRIRFGFGDVQSHLIYARQQAFCRS